MKRMKIAALCALVCLVGSSVLAEGEPLGVLADFDLETAATSIRTIMISVIGILGGVYGAALGFTFLRWGFRKIKGALQAG